MDKTKITRIKSKRKNCLVTIRITRDLSKWLKDKDYSPTGIFNESVKDLGYKVTNESKI